MSCPEIDRDVQVARRERCGELSLDIPAAFGHCIRQLVDVDDVGLEREHAHGRLAEHFQFGDGVDAGDQLLGGFLHGLDDVHEAFFAQVSQDRPGARHRAAALGTEHGRVDKRVGGGVGAGEDLVFADILAAVQNRRSAFGGVAVFVQVGRDGGHAWHAEIEIGHFVAQFAHERQMNAAHAAVHMEEQILFLGNRTDLGNRVDHALRIARR